MGDLDDAPEPDFIPALQSGPGTLGPQGATGAAGPTGPTGPTQRAGSGVPTVSATSYAPINSYAGAFGGETTREQVIYVAVTLTSLMVQNVGGAVGAGGGTVFTVRKNGAATALTVTVPSNSPQNTFVEITGQAVAFAKGDRICIEAVCSNATTTYAWAVV